MATWAISAGSGQISGGVLWGIVLVFVAFALVNFRFARTLRRRWEAQMRQHAAGGTEGANPP
jgi:hypothetical protein